MDYTSLYFVALAPSCLMQETAYLALEAKTYRLVTASMMETACQRGSQIRDDQAKAQILPYGKNTKR